MRAFEGLHAIGDSHCRLFCDLVNKDNVHWLGPITMHRVGRDGVEGLKSSREWLDAFGTLSPRSWVPTMSRGDIVAWVFGEIDVRCHLVKAVAARGEGALHDLIQPYLKTIAAFSAETGTLPVIVSLAPARNSHNRRFPCVGSMDERKGMTRKVNSLLRTSAPLYGARYCDLWGRVTDTQGEVLPGMLADEIHLGGKAGEALALEITQTLRGADAS
jgi:hypothetical protein